MLTPWHNHRAELSPSEYEREVTALLAALGRDIPGFAVTHQDRVSTPEGDFRFDVTATFEQLGVTFLVLVECKDHRRPVEREDVQVLADKIRAASAQKGILFSTNGFQRGAIEYAAARHIALVRFVEGELTYETKAVRIAGQPHPKPPPWADIPPFVGWLVSLRDGNVHVATIESSRADPLADFLNGAA